MRDMIYFGTRERMTWVRAPDANYDGSRIGWEGGAAALLNGGTITQRSTTAHRTYNYSWTSLSRNEVRQITDYAEGVWGPNAIFLLDPFAMDKNVLPQHWASPRTVLQDAPVLSGGPRREAVEYPVEYINTQGYPTKGILYQNSVNWPVVAQRPKLFIPIPPSHTLWFGAHGATAATSNLVVTPASGAPAAIPILANTSDVRFSNSWNGAQVSGVEISFAGTGSSIITGLMAQVLPTGVTPERGGFISGQGHSGLRFGAQPSLTQNNVAMDRQSLAVQLIEDEAWR